jgi:outer membrane biosynthesis protein TonB
MQTTASAASPLALVPLARQLLDLARKSAGLPLPELQASLMLLASDALSKFDGSTAPASPPPSQQPSAEAHPPAPPPAAQAPEPAPPVVPPRPAAAASAPVVPVAEPRAKETPPGSAEKKEEKEEAQKEGPPATANLKF